MNRATVCICILNWNGWRDTLACLSSLLPLLAQTPATLIVCDNASDDDSWVQLHAWISAHWDAAEICVIDDYHPPQTLPATPLASVTLLRTAYNGGFAAGHNAALRYAMRDPELHYYWLLNNDIQVRPDSLAHLLHCAATTPHVGLWGSTVLQQGSADIVQCAGGCRYYPWLTLFRAHLGGRPWAKVRTAPLPVRLDYIYGAALLLRAECVQRVGLLNEDYFLFYEELDLCRRLNASGYALGWCRDSLIYHQGSASIGTPAQGNRAKLIRANYYENLSTLKFTARFHPYLLPIAALFRIVLKALAVSIRGQFFLLPPLGWAYYDFFSRTQSRRYEPTLKKQSP
jgi:GT2 family glycosyltransferase